MSQNENSLEREREGGGRMEEERRKRMEIVPLGGRFVRRRLNGSTPWSRRMVEASARTRSGFLLLEDRALITLPLLYCLFALSSAEESGSVRVVPVFPTGRERFFSFFFLRLPTISILSRFLIFFIDC